jgi:tripartite-type tricarboxylate transporter receptor subunit TctC
MFAPAATPLPIQRRLRDSLSAVLQTEAVRAITQGNGNRTIFQTGEEARRRLAQDLSSRRAFVQSIAASDS